MSDFLLRPAKAEDTEQIVKIWQECFGDSADFIADMLRCGILENAVGAEIGGKLRCVMFAFDSLRCGGVPASYLYALGTELNFRGKGLGRAVTDYAAHCAFERGAKAVFLRPGSEGLEKWYCDVIGARVVSRCGTETYCPDISTSEKAHELSPWEYFQRRPFAFWGVDENFILAQGVVNRYYGGSFLSAAGGILCAEERDGAVLVREVFSPDPEATLSAAAQWFSASELQLLCRSPEGTALLAMPGSEIPVFSGEFPPLPFTFD